MHLKWGLKNDTFHFKHKKNNSEHLHIYQATDIYFYL